MGRKRRHRLDPPVCSHRDIVWCQTQLLRPHLEMLHQTNGFLGHPSSKEQLDSQHHSYSNILVQGQMIDHSVARIVTTVVSIAGVPSTLLKIVQNPRNLIRVRTSTRTIKSRARSKTCKGRSTLLLLLNFWSNKILPTSLIQVLSLSVLSYSWISGRDSF